MEIEKIFLVNNGDTSDERQHYLVSKLDACNFMSNTPFEIINVQN